MEALHPGRLALLFAFSEEFHSPAEINTLRNVTVFLALNSSACRISLNAYGDYMHDWLWCRLRVDLADHYLPVNPL